MTFQRQWLMLPLCATVAVACLPAPTAPSSPSPSAPVASPSAVASSSPAAITPVSQAPAQVTKVSGASVTIDGLKAKLEEFRAVLGNPLNTTPGVTGGRREVNWDAVPDASTNVDTFPGNFFNSTDPAAAAGRKRGILFTTPGTGFRVSDNDFNDLNAAYGQTFAFFSEKRTFAPVGSNVMECTFQVPGTSTEASVHGFGAVFLDVDKGNASFIEYFSDSTSLGRYEVPESGTASKGYSFLGVAFPGNLPITRVVITSGDAALSKDALESGAYPSDVVALDDFFYSEPVARK